MAEFIVRFMSLSGRLRTVKIETFSSKADALTAVTEYASTEGYTDVKLVDDGDDYLRVTGRTKGGRCGRNVAFIDYGEY